MAVVKCVCSALWLLILSMPAVDGLFANWLVHCQFSARDGSDAVYLEKFYFNKRLMGEYSSVTGKYTGYVKETIRYAEDFNKSPYILEKRRRISNHSCMSRVSAVYDALKDTVQPNVRLRSQRPYRGSRHPGLLVCSVHNFYPKTIRVTWLRNGQEVTSDVSFTEELTNGNWLYQIHTYLEYTPIHGEKITCKVEHASLQEPMLTDWDTAMTESQRIKIGMGTAGLLAGLMVLLAGLICYMRSNTAGLVQVPLREASSMREDTPAGPQ